MNPNMNPKNECDCCEMSLETYLYAHQPNYYSFLHVMLYYVKYNNSIPFFEEQSCEVNKIVENN